MGVDEVSTYWSCRWLIEVGDSQVKSRINCLVVGFKIRLFFGGTFCFTLFLGQKVPSWTKGWPYMQMQANAKPRGRLFLIDDRNFMTI